MAVLDRMKDDTLHRTRSFGDWLRFAALDMMCHICRPAYTQPAIKSTDFDRTDNPTLLFIAVSTPTVAAHSSSEAWSRANMTHCRSCKARA